MRDKKGQAVIGVLIVALLLVAVIGGGFALYKMGAFSGEKQTTTQEKTTNTETTKEIVKETKSGGVASIGVYVRDVGQKNTNTKVAVPVYCQDDAGIMVIDGDTSSTTAEITGKTSLNKQITCWAFNSTYQTKKPTVVTVDEEFKHVVIDTFNVPTSASITFYTDTLATGTGGAINVTGVGADLTGTLNKMRIKNNNTAKILPLQGVYFNIVTGSNISKIDVSGGATISGGDHSSTMLNDVTGKIATSVSTRKDNWDYVFEFDDDAQASGNQALLLEEGDYVETGNVKVTGDGDGCSSAGELVSSYGFTSGFYRLTKGTGVASGYETDASSASVISSDVTGDTFYCTA